MDYLINIKTNRALVDESDTYCIVNKMNKAVFINISQYGPYGPCYLPGELCHIYSISCLFLCIYFVDSFGLFLEPNHHT